MRSAAPPRLAVACARTWLAPGLLGLNISRITGEPCSGQSTRLLPLATSPTLAEVEPRCLGNGDRAAHARGVVARHVAGVLQQSRLIEGVDEPHRLTGGH